MSGDRLSRIETQVRFVYDRSPDGNGLVLPNRDVLALVEIAKAARLRKAFGHDKNCAWVTGGPNPPSCDCGHVELCDALARLGSGAAEEDA